MRIHGRPFGMIGRRTSHCAAPIPTPTAAPEVHWITPSLRMRFTPGSMRFARTSPTTDATARPSAPPTTAARIHAGQDTVARGIAMSWTAETPSPMTAPYARTNGIPPRNALNGRAVVPVNHVLTATPTEYATIVAGIHAIQLDGLMAG